MRSCPVIPRCMVKYTSPCSGSTKNLPARVTLPNARPSMRPGRSWASASLSMKGSTDSTETISRPGSAASNWQRTVSTSGSSGTSDLHALGSADAQQVETAGDDPLRHQAQRQPRRRHVVARADDSAVLVEHVEPPRDLLGVSGDAVWRTTVRGLPHDVLERREHLDQVALEGGGEHGRAFRDTREQLRALAEAPR